MFTYAFAVVTILYMAGQPPSEVALVADHGLSRMDCLKLFEAYKPSQTALPNGMQISLLPRCQKEKA
jgi:hypothetical protein